MDTLDLDKLGLDAVVLGLDLGKLDLDEDTLGPAVVALGLG